MESAGMVGGGEGLRARGVGRGDGMEGGLDVGVG